MGHEDAHIGRRSLLTWSENTDAENWTLVGISLFLTVFAGLMSGLTLGERINALLPVPLWILWGFWLFTPSPRVVPPFRVRTSSYFDAFIDA